MVIISIIISITIICGLTLTELCLLAGTQTLLVWERQAGRLSNSPHDQREALHLVALAIIRAIISVATHNSLRKACVTHDVPPCNALPAHVFSVVIRCFAVPPRLLPECPKSRVTQSQKIIMLQQAQTLAPKIIWSQGSLFAAPPRLLHARAPQSGNCNARL